MYTHTRILRKTQRQAFPSSASTLLYSSQEMQPHQVNTLFGTFLSESFATGTVGYFRLGLKTTNTSVKKYVICTIGRNTNYDLDELTGLYKGT